MNEIASVTEMSKTDHVCQEAKRTEFYKKIDIILLMLTYPATICDALQIRKMKKMASVTEFSKTTLIRQL
ncbi:hypothetical protein R3W88_032745 [Solanum pinnatisectum]|uniref:Uncharacterized protein n=1 Tax=Solanum pinnatisectum TaxID=50273 RepID=A0AAV9LQY7_9SOLN|nr:hypothetical protein R3W88_032745 [Solanum pinnatisectum]